jgi:1-pyrroline-5-carboxylate dehydrogenase
VNIIFIYNFIGCLEKMDNHLTCGIVSNDPRFINEVVSNTVNGVTYVGSRARTTGAP